MPDYLLVSGYLAMAGLLMGAFALTRQNPHQAAYSEARQVTSHGLCPTRARAKEHLEIGSAANRTEIFDQVHENLICPQPISRLHVCPVATASEDACST